MTPPLDLRRCATAPLVHFFPSFSQAGSGTGGGQFGMARKQAIGLKHQAAGGEGAFDARVMAIANYFG
jgi:hypothetical protein